MSTSVTCAELHRGKVSPRFRGLALFANARVNVSFAVGRIGVLRESKFRAERGRESEVVEVEGWRGRTRVGVEQRAYARRCEVSDAQIDGYGRPNMI